jgi:hypothetical protein
MKFLLMQKLMQFAVFMLAPAVAAPVSALPVVASLLKVKMIQLLGRRSD